MLIEYYCGWEGVSILPCEEGEEEACEYCRFVYSYFPLGGGARGNEISDLYMRRILYHSIIRCTVCLLTAEVGAATKFFRYFRYIG